ncbi:ATP-binding cassette domain-containing protein [Cohnella rhizosphaerae]|uniref:ATP-binding cassette domain-containing protein n=1 Tax=Cohnella rhizosphaerae TaxID=1457232 RepID=A0A9X4KNS8_9BACL|nr:ATP-binding cassette domain-containing protein [Cohnella rhizosphaerae]MDG0807978.1 ATP-binding cassette domain-containing protein [Cohnella rhizosphaerae]
MTFMIEVKDLRKSFGDQQVLRGVDIAVPQGQIYALLGPNGAGKTTLINILTTLVAADGGSARIAGYDVAAESGKVKQSISLTGQFAAVDEMLSAEENLQMMCRLSGMRSAEAKRRTAELLGQFDLIAAAGKRVKTYSGGMRRRVDLAISLVASRPVLFLDEPTTGLDTVSRRALWDIIERLKASGMTIFLTTQYLEEADQLADRIGVINGGRLVAEGTAAELKARIGGEVIELTNEREQWSRTISTTGSAQDIGRILNGLAASLPPDTQVTIRRPSMDDVFIALTQQPSEVSVS